MAKSKNKHCGLLNSLSKGGNLNPEISQHTNPVCSVQAYQSLPCEPSNNSTPVATDYLENTNITQLENNNNSTTDQTMFSSLNLDQLINNSDCYNNNKSNISVNTDQSLASSKSISTRLLLANQRLRNFPSIF